jgi:hypothetical protein
MVADVVEGSLGGTCCLGSSHAHMCVVECVQGAIHKGHGGGRPTSSRLVVPCVVHNSKSATTPPAETMVVVGPAVFRSDLMVVVALLRGTLQLQ